MAILESSFLIDVMRNNQQALEILDSLEQQEPELLVATPSVMELWIGALLSTRPDSEKRKVEELLDNLEKAPLDAPSAKRSAEVWAELSQRGVAIEAIDTMIAGIALSRGEKVVTRDEHYARIPGLKVLKY